MQRIISAGFDGQRPGMHLQAHPPAQVGTQMNLPMQGEAEWQQSVIGRVASVQREAVAFYCLFVCLRLLGTANCL